MCLITLNWQPSHPQRLVIAANRDEFYARPTLALHHWPGQGILAGQDLQAGGTWLGLSGRPGPIRMAALTNYRDVTNQRADAASRGHLTAAFLKSQDTAHDYLEALSAHTGRYNAFNLILFDGQQLMGFESRHRRIFALPPGITSVSNADFNTPWPKLERLRTSFEQALAADGADEAGGGHRNILLEHQLFKLLSDDRVAPDAELPQTGISLDRERVLSAAFIHTNDYGTRASSVLCVGQHSARFTERCFDTDGLKGEVTHTLLRGNSCLT